MSQKTTTDGRLMFVFFGLIGGCFFAPSALAQLPQCRLHAVFPPGAQAGTEVDVTVTAGQDLDDLTTLLFNHPGLKATQKTKDVAGQTKPVNNSFTVQVASDVPAGFYEVRALGMYGLSNPRSFVVGSNPEVLEAASNNDFDSAQEIELNQVVNAKSERATDVDFYKFTAKKGQRLLAVCNSARIDSKLDGIVEIYDASERRIDAASRSRVWMHGDPVADFVVPADGVYFAKVVDFTYRGGNEYFYRFTVTTAPWIDFVLPPAGQPGTKSRYTLYGRNLPGGKPSDFVAGGKPLEQLEVEIALPNEPSRLDVETSLDPVQAGIDGIQYVLPSPHGRSNAAFIGFATAPLIAEQEPNNKADAVQKVEVPAEIYGQFQERRDADGIEFSAKAGTVYYVEVFAQRTGTTADPYFWVEQVTKKDDGTEQIKRLTSQDDNTANLAQYAFDTNTDDPVWKFQVPADGTYRVYVKDRYAGNRRDPRLVYRLAVRPENPDFRLVAVPQRSAGNTYTNSPVAVRKGDNVYVPVFAFRQDGFDGAINITADGLPAGVTCPPVVIGPGQTSTELIFSAAADAKPWAGRVTISGKAVIDDPAKTRAVITAEAAIKPARDAVEKLRKPVEQAEAQFKPAEMKLTGLQEQLAKKPDNEGLKKQVAAAQKDFDAKKQAVDNAKKQLADAEKKLQDSLAAVDTAKKAKAAAVKEVQRVARTGTVLWDGTGNNAADSRVSRSLGLSVIDETAAFQVTTTPQDITANQSRQILVPLKLDKRNGFDTDVKLAVAGVPKNANIEVPAVTIKKGETETLLRVFVKDNAKVGDYTVYLNGQAQVSYARNPAAVTRAKADQSHIDGKIKETQTKINTAKEALKKATESEKANQELVKKSKQAVDEAKKQKQPDEAIQKAEQAVKDAEAKLQAATNDKNTAAAAVKTAEGELKNFQNIKKQIDAEVKKVEAAAKPKNINVTNPSSPIVIRVRPSPVKLKAAVPNGGALKRGAKIDIKVTVTRQNNFQGPVKLSLPLPPNVTGLSAAEVTIPAGQNEGVLTVQADGNATEGALANLVIQAAMEFEGQAAVDVPVTLKVSK
ncbi:hypothetical protein [Thalassoroseus pseudoceratinae]|uniref:hypothetical protein n=1 Tax=Thalassoroseus pseudoceratinae TaxID=2713176 RepID=UPI00141EA063|nr:hypothetical protein [Thalassoroseus pseudoceratinae]